MPLINCTLCGKVFNSQYLTLCDDCTDKNDMGNPYKLVKEYLQKHPGSTALEVAHATGVPKSIIIRLINDEVISVVKIEK